MTRTGRRSRRGLIAGLATVVVLVLVFAAGAGYFAGKMRSDGLAVPGPTHGYDLRALASAPGQVTLREAPGQPRNDALRAGDVYGLARPGGSGLLGAGAASDAGGPVLRTLTIKAGRAPTAGSRAQLRRDVYQDPRPAYGFPRRTSTSIARGTAAPRGSPLAASAPGRGR